jgi:hypothetical protein
VCCCVLGVRRGGRGKRMNKRLVEREREETVEKEM